MELSMAPTRERERERVVERETEMDDSMEQQKRQAMAEFRRAQLSKRALQALLSVSSFFSLFLLVSSSSWLPSLLHEAGLHLSLLLIHLAEYCCFWVDRKAMFLLCNLILVVIAMDAGLLASVMKGRDHCDELSAVSSESQRRPEVSSAGSAVGSLQALAKSSKPQKEEKEEGKEEGKEEEKEEGNDDGGEEEEGKEEEEDEEGDGYADMDELNKRFEDFIEKVKRDRKMEALQMVLL